MLQEIEQRTCLHAATHGPKAAQWSMAEEILFKVIRILSKGNKEIIQNTNGHMLEVVRLLSNTLGLQQ